MTDLDVQDIRNMVAKQKEQHQQALQKIKRLAESPNVEQGDIQIIKTIRAHHDREERERRLGLSW